MAKNVNIESAADIISEFNGEDEVHANWPKRCATGQVLLRNDEGKVIATDLYVSCEMTEDGKFDTEANNPLVIHNAPGGVPQSEFLIVQVRERGRNGRVRPWINRMMSAFTAKFLDKRVPSKDETPEESENLGTPKTDEVPV